MRRPLQIHVFGLVFAASAATAHSQIVSYSTFGSAPSNIYSTAFYEFGPSISSQSALAWKFRTTAGGPLQELRSAVGRSSPTVDVPVRFEFFTVGSTGGPDASLGTVSGSSAYYAVPGASPQSFSTYFPSAAILLQPDTEYYIALSRPSTSVIRWYVGGRQVDSLQASLGSFNQGNPGNWEVATTTAGFRAAAFEIVVPAAPTLPALFAASLAIGSRRRRNTR